MKLKIIKFFLAVAIVMGWVGLSVAVPILNDGLSGPIETLADGSSYGHYINSGDLLGVETGNNLGNAETLAEVEALVKVWLGLGSDSDFVLSMTGSIQVTNYNPDGTIASGASNTGTWETIYPVDLISFYAVKAGNAFAMYYVNPADSTGSWSTYDIWATGWRGTGGNDGLEISHFTGYNPSAAPVPEPATILLFGTGLLGLARFGRKKFLKK
jgi:hypothetical protein